jgi:hypothetical protein
MRVTQVHGMRKLRRIAALPFVLKMLVVDGCCCAVEHSSDCVATFGYLDLVIRLAGGEVLSRVGVHQREGRYRNQFEAGSVTT